MRLIRPHWFSIHYMYGERRPEFDPDQFLRNLKKSWDQFSGRLPGGGGGSGGLLIGGLFIVAILLWLASGFYTVGLAEQASLRLFGEFRGTAGPGLHWYPPSPIGTRDKVNVQEQRRMELGFRAGGVAQRDVPVEALMITGDLNIVDVQMVVQYKVETIEDYLFRVADPGDPDRQEVGRHPDARTLKDATEATLRQIVGQRSIDDVLTVGREAVQEDTRIALQKILNDYGAGILVQQVVLQNVRPPDQVRDAFDDVVRARVDKESRINQARAYEQDQIPRIRGEAEQTVQAAQAFKEARIARARGESEEFLAILAEYQQSKEVTRQRLYLEAMEDILPGIRLFVIDPEAGTGTLPLLSLTPGSTIANPPAAQGGR